MQGIINLKKKEHAGTFYAELTPVIDILRLYYMEKWYILFILYTYTSINFTFEHNVAIHKTNLYVPIKYCSA
jgi:hypothetical protein